MSINYFHRGLGRFATRPYWRIPTFFVAKIMQIVYGT